MASAAMAGNLLLGPETPAAPWRDAFRLEAADFPHGTHDDQVDALSDAVNELALGTGYDYAGAAARGL